MVFVLTLSVLHLSLIWYHGKVVLGDCGISGYLQMYLYCIVQIFIRFTIKVLPVINERNSILWFGNFIHIFYFLIVLKLSRGLGVDVTLLYSVVAFWSDFIIFIWRHVHITMMTLYVACVFLLLLCDYLVITKTRLYNFDPVKPHFYIVKLGFTGVYNIFHISAPNIDCGYSLEPPRRGGSNEYPQSMFGVEIWKISEFFIWKFSCFFFFFFFFCGKIFSIFEWTCFRNVNDAEPNKIKKSIY